MSKAPRFLKFTPIIFAIFGAFLIICSFFIKSQKISKQPVVSYNPVEPQVAGKTTKIETATSQINKITLKVSRVVDGDTIELESGQKVRYIGVNTPEIVHPTKSIECFGHEASAKNKELVEGKSVQLEKDVSETDKYGRLLRYVYVDGIFINNYLVSEGFANSSSYPPDIKYQEQFRKSEINARQNNRGLWASCVAGIRKQLTSLPLSDIGQSDENGCTIKGNISSGGKIFHTPGQYYYNKTRIHVSKGERWFCSEDQASNAGWRKSLK